MVRTASIACVSWALLSSSTAVAEKLAANLSVQTETQAILKYVGKDSEQAMQQQPNGLLIDLPITKPGAAQVSQVGLETAFWIKGDFTATVAYEILSDALPTTGYGMGVIFRLNQDSDQMQRVILAHLLHRKRSNVYSASFVTLDESNIPVNRDEKFFETSTMSGRLRLQRIDSTYSLLVAEGESGDFRVLRSVDFNDPDVKNIAVLVDTGGATENVKVLLKRFEIEADTALFSAYAPNSPSHSAAWIGSGLVTGILLLLLGARFIRRRVQR